MGGSALGAQHVMKEIGEWVWGTLERSLHCKYSGIASFETESSRDTHARVFGTKFFWGMQRYVYDIPLAKKIHHGYSPFYY